MYSPCSDAGEHAGVDVVGTDNCRFHTGFAHGLKLVPQRLVAAHSGELAGAVVTQTGDAEHPRAASNVHHVTVILVQHGGEESLGGLPERGIKGLGICKGVRFLKGQGKGI